MKMVIGKTAWVFALGLALVGCPDGGDETDAGVAQDGMVVDDAAPPDASPDMADDATPGDAAPPDAGVDAGPMDAGADAAPVDPCACVECDAGERCDPGVGECVIVGEPAAGEASTGCEADTDCADGTCNLAVPGGFCQRACDAEGWCGSVNLRCVSVDAVGEGMPREFCADECSASDCRDGWVCVADPDGAFCLPGCVEAGCGPSSYCDAASGLCEPFEGPAIAEGAPCNSRDDRCDAGLACLPDDETGRGLCRALCEPDDAPCADGGFCAVLIDAAPDEPAIGICLPDAGCDPTAPEATCGPDSACVAAPPVTLCVGTGEQALGQPCSGDALCEAGLICQYGVCKKPCRDRDVCADGEECLDYSQQVGREFGFCHRRCEPLSGRLCDRNSECTLVDMIDGAPLGGCVPRRDAPLDVGEACTPDDTPYGDCRASYICDEQAPLRPVCRQLCTADEPADCGATLCALNVFDAPFDSLGLCMGGCNVIGGVSGCAGAVPLTCSFTGLVGLDTEGVEMLVGECVPNLGRGQARTGEPCAIDEARGIHNCENGNICAVVARGGNPECVQLCRRPPPGRNPCVQDDRSCVTGLFGGNETFGACLP